jgi:RNA polymerase sigma factor (sigma-70 family)
MSASPNEFEQLMERMRQGCPEAAREILERYGEAIRHVVRRRMDKRLRPIYDSLDFCQNVWASFFHDLREKYTFHTPEELISFLSGVAHRKIVDAYRKRVGTLDKPRQQPELLRTQTDNDPGNEPLVRQTTASQLAMAEEQWQRMLAGQPPRLRQALQMLRDGYEHGEVAECLGVHPKMLQRLLQSLQKRGLDVQ